MFFSFQLSVISYQLSVISYQLSVISYQLSVISYQLSVIKTVDIDYVQGQHIYLTGYSVIKKKTIKEKKRNVQKSFVGWANR
ncbi:MAG: hypothetical protein VSS75_008530 [Candidatus Parabeggiatoa sp.]|nr:hypothetical protein [Candidatus Parabeggiatoa sp.]